MMTLKRYAYLVALLVMLFSIFSLPAFAAGNSTKKRHIAEEATLLDRIIFRLQGCRIVHELDDAVSIECPQDVSPRNAREERVFAIVDMEANEQIGAVKVWAQNYTGKNVNIAVLDTGIDAAHEELKASIAVGGRSFVLYTPLINDDNGHGTHVAGIITADGIVSAARGAAPDANIWAAKVCDSQGRCYESDIAKAIEYVVYNKPARIISLSLGGGGTAGKNCDRDYLARKVNWASKNGILVVAAAGNTRGIVSSPACASQAIAVGAVDKTDKLAWFSGTGNSIDLLAPGVSIYSTWLNNGYAALSGTSMAAPFVSATAALMMEKNPSMSPADARDALYAAAADVGYVKVEQGNGRVDAYRAVFK